MKRKERMDEMKWMKEEEGEIQEYLFMMEPMEGRHGWGIAEPRI